jgi:hypothetical protein
MGASAKKSVDVLAAPAKAMNIGWASEISVAVAMP